VTSHLETQKIIPRCGLRQHTIYYSAYKISLHTNRFTHLLRYHKFIISKLIHKLTLITPTQIF